jgi:hypothetical protein
MAVKTNYNVKVRLDNSSFPITNQTVIWDPNSGSFEITASSALGGNQNLQEVTDVGEVTTNASYFLNGQSLGYGGLYNQDATSGFIDVGGLAYTHVTPQSIEKSFTLMGVQTSTVDGNIAVKDYPENYIVYNGGAILTPGTSGDGGYACSPRYENLTNNQPILYITDVIVGDEVQINYM